MTAPIIARVGRASNWALAARRQLCYTAAVADIEIPSAWVRLSKEGLQGTVMIIGASDTGKSTLARFLFQEPCCHGCRAACLDTDMGQQALGLPTTLNLALGPIAVYNLDQLARGAILGFQDGEGFALGLEVVEELHRQGNSIVVRTPLPGMEGVWSIRFGGSPLGS